MKTILVLAMLVGAYQANAGVISKNDDIVICVAKPKSINPNSWRLVMLKKSENAIVYQNSSHGNEKNLIEAIGVVGTKMIVQHNGETVLFDLKGSNAAWSEDKFPQNSQTYSTCTSFAKYDYDMIRAWFNSVVKTQEWTNKFGE